MQVPQKQGPDTTAENTHVDKNNTSPHEGALDGNDSTAREMNPDG
jgi:hypothetical protein